VQLKQAPVRQHLERAALAKLPQDDALQEMV